LYCGNDYKGEENVVKAFQDHFRKLATFSLQDKIDLPYHNMVGFALKIALFDEEVIAADFMISQILSIFSPVGISPVTSLCLILLIYDPLLPISMPRGYGGVAVIWKNEIDHLVRPIQKENSPAKSSRKHLRSPSDKIVYRF
jgi:hypothetical protein